MKERASVKEARRAWRGALGAASGHVRALAARTVEQAFSLATIPRAYRARGESASNRLAWNGNSEILVRVNYELEVKALGE